MALAPGDGAVFRPISAAYFEDPAHLRQGPKDDMLGFGAGEAVTFLTSVALSVMTDVVVYLCSELAKAASSPCPLPRPLPPGGVGVGMGATVRRMGLTRRPALADHLASTVGAGAPHAEEEP